MTFGFLPSTPGAHTVGLPQAAFLTALHAFRGAGRKLPVDLVLVAEGEEEIGSPHIAQVVRRPDVAAALARVVGVFMPSAMRGVDLAE